MTSARTPSETPAFHQARWSEPLIMTLGSPGRRGVMPPRTSEKVAGNLKEALAAVPPDLRRSEAPDLPELSQPEVVRHFTRLSQMVLGANVAVSLGLGTTTMKYNPVIHELITRSSKLADIHPEQDAETIQGTLEIIYRLGEYLSAISGMDRFSLQPGGGSQGILSNALTMRAFHAARGEDSVRDEVVTTIFSHPADAAAPAMAGYKVVSLYPDERGFPSLAALEASLSERTAGLFITNPEDTGIFNPEIDRFVQAVHDVGGLCVYDQANANGSLGIVRARDVGFDMCHFNLHKTFAVPHGCMGGAVGAVGVTEDLAKYLPTPTVTFDGDRYSVTASTPESIGTLRAWFGNVHSIVKAYAWITTMGAEGLKTAARMSVLNNNYLSKAITSIPGAGVSFAAANHTPRLEQTRYTWEELTAGTGVTSTEIHDRVLDFGVQTYFTSHHPWVVPEPFTLEPAESYSLEDLEEYASVLRAVATEASLDPMLVRTAPHRGAVAHHVVPSSPTEPAMTLQAFKRRRASKASP